MEQNNMQTNTSEGGSKNDSLSIPIAIVVAGLLIGGAILFSDKPNIQNNPKNTAPAPLNIMDEANQAPVSELVLRPDDHVFGNPNANVLIFEYSDSECPFCKRFHSTMHDVMGKNAESGTIAWIYRHFPLDQLHAKARKEAEAMECVAEIGGNDAFWKFTDQLFAITPSNDGLDSALLPQIAQSIGTDMKAFSDCLSSGRYSARVESDHKSGELIGVSGTPYSIVYNKKTGKQMPINGALDADKVRSFIGAVGGLVVP